MDIKPDKKAVIALAVQQALAGDDRMLMRLFDDLEADCMRHAVYAVERCYGDGVGAVGLRALVAAARRSVISRAVFYINREFGQRGNDNVYRAEESEMWRLLEQLEATNGH